VITVINPRSGTDAFTASRRIPFRSTWAMFGVVINHYWRPSHTDAAIESARLAMALLARCNEVSDAVLVDSGPEGTPGFPELCAKKNVQYLHQPGGLSFSEAFNEGAARLTTDWVALLCSDVYVFPDTFEAFSKFIAERSDEAIGCLIPYLSTCDVHTQIERHRRPRRFDARVPVMSVNLNVFPKAAFDLIGGIPGDYSGDYNDVATCIALRRVGLDVFVVGEAQAVHYGVMTKRDGTTIDRSSDLDAFKAAYPDFHEPASLWQVSVDRLIYSRALRAAWRAAVWFNRLRALLGRKPLARPFNWILREVPSQQRLRRRPSRRGRPESRDPQPT
jgi:GT2 family glycosyltransferase